MRFQLVDRIIDLEPGVSIRTVKNLTMAEEYLAEHFPSFPVMPGVLMVEAVTQSAAWLMRVSDQFRHSVVFLKSARNVKFGQFVVPGRQLQITCDLVEDDGAVATFKAKGEIDGKNSVSGRFQVHRFNLADRHRLYENQDERLRSHFLQVFEMLAGPDLRERLKLRDLSSTLV